MNSAWISRFRRSQAAQGSLVGLACSPEGIALSVLQPDADGPRLRDLFYLPCPVHEVRERLAQVVTRLQCRKARCRLVLDPAEFRLLYTSIPEVPAGELREAMRWRVQELIEFPIESAELEFYAVPRPLREGGQRSMAVAVVRNDVIDHYRAICDYAGLSLEVIDIPHLALRNIAERFPEAQRGVAFVVLDSHHGVIQVQKNDELFVSRELDFGWKQLLAELHGDLELPEGGLARLALELQRSLDYYESHFGMPPVSGVVVAPIAQWTQGLVDGLNASVGVMARALDLTALIPAMSPYDDELQQRCLTSLGAALRVEASA